jgi:hypothetical protein
VSGVRPFVKETDLQPVAELHRMVFGPGHHDSARGPDRLENHLSEVFLENPWRDDALPSLLYEDDDGAIIGFLGAVPRPMVLNGQRLKVAIASRFMVHPVRRGRVGLQLLRRFFSGAQDLSLTEGNDLTRTIWQGRGGTTAALYSIRWTRVLRPSRYVVSFLRRHGMRSPVALALTPLCRAMDALTGRLGRWPFRPSVPSASGEELTEYTLLAGLSEATRRRSLRPEYDEQSLQWLLEVLAARKGRGHLRKVLVRRAGQDAVGWYLYYANPAGISEVIQVAAKDGSMGDVLRHLFHDAWEHGAVAVSGQLDPPFIQAFASEHCLLHGGGGSWTLAHSRRAELLEPLYRGNAFLTRLEGEWWTGF